MVNTILFRFIPSPRILCDYLGILTPKTDYLPRVDGNKAIKILVHTYISPLLWISSFTMCELLCIMKNHPLNMMKKLMKITEIATLPKNA